MPLTHIIPAAIALGFRTAMAAAGEQVMYQAEDQQIELEALPAAAETATEDTAGKVMVDHDDQDFLVWPAELRLSGNAEPAPGHKVIRQIGETSVTYQLVARKGKPCWRWSDAYHVKLRLHTKRVA